jgi:hypothetical protein
VCVQEPCVYLLSPPSVVIGNNYNIICLQYLYKNFNIFSVLAQQLSWVVEPSLCSRVEGVGPLSHKHTGGGDYIASFTQHTGLLGLSPSRSFTVVNVVEELVTT